MSNENEKDKKKEDDDQNDDQKTATHGTSDINGQIAADLAFKEGAEKLLAKLKSQNTPPAEEPERAGEKPKGTEKHK